jgi:SAM-dependent methyltransferase
VQEKNQEAWREAEQPIAQRCFALALLAMPNGRKMRPGNPVIWERSGKVKSSRKLRDLFEEPEISHCNLDGSDRLLAHRRILERKRMIREVMSEFHQKLMQLDIRFFGATRGERIELGAGVFPMRVSFPDVLATDIVSGPGIDRVVDAEDTRLADCSVRTIIGQNCFHHFPDPEKFFSECERVIVPGGGVILIEPYHSLAATLLYPRLFASEGFDKEMIGWRVPQTGPMSGANQALSYIVFVRDRTKFLRRFPTLEIVHERPLDNYLRYLISGGLNFRQLLPDVAIPLLKGAEFVLRPLVNLLAIHHIIVLRHR